jgi:hypothetical protein
MQDKLWFKRKRYGWGWYPATWEGGVVLFVWILLFALGLSVITPDSLAFYLYNLGLIVLLIAVCYKTGEKPRWQWGSDKGD